MSPQEYKKWMRDFRKRDASLPSFFGVGEKRTLNVLEGDASPKSIKRWESFKARHGTQFCKKPTYKQAIALRNWGISVSLRGLKK